MPETPLVEGRHFTATVFGFTVLPSSAPISYGLRWQQEVCPDTKSVHLQVYFFTHANKTNIQASAWLTDFFKSKHVNAKPCKTREHASHLYNSYVCKTATAIPNTSVTLNEDKIPDFVKNTHVWDRITTLVVGPNHTGKTTWARLQCKEFAPDEKPYRFPTQSKCQKGRWIGDYKGERCIIIDEFQFGQFGLDELKMLVDRCPQPVAVKAGGASVEVTAERIYLLCNTHITKIEKILEHPQWEGRINVLKCMRKKFPPDPTKTLRREGCVKGETPDTYEDGSPWVEPEIPSYDDYAEKKTKTKKRKLILQQNPENSGNVLLQNKQTQ